MSLQGIYQDFALLRTIDDVLLFSFKFVKYFNELSTTCRRDCGDLFHCALDEQDRPVELMDLVEHLRQPMALDLVWQIGSIYNAGKVREIETLFRVLHFFGIPPKEAISRICDNPYGYITALKGVFGELRRDRPLTIEEDIIIAFKEHRVSWHEARAVLNLKNATVKTIWTQAAKLKMEKTLAEVMREREARKREGKTGYHHLSLGERTFITFARLLGLTQKLIAEMLGRSPSTISREVRRFDPEAYGPLADYTHTKAWDDYVKKRENCGRKTMLDLRDKKGTLITTRIRDYILREKLTPEQIAKGKFKNEEEFDCYLSKSSIYDWINKGKIYGLSRENLRRKGKKRKKYQTMCEKYEKGTSILERPEVVNDRSEFGHFEADSVVSGHNGKGRVFTFIERKTRFFMGKVVLEGTAANFVDFIKQVRKKYGDIIKSITVDNGSEFAGWQELESMGIKIYFARPYCSNDKGCIEHHNGLLRVFYPKKTDFSKVHQNSLDRGCLRKINNWPRGVLGWKTPQELFNHELELARQASAA